MKITTVFKDLSNAISLCNKCGACYYVGEDEQLPLCPMYSYDKSFAFSPSGLNFVSRALLEARIGYTPSVADFAFSCTGCGACNETCYAVPYPEPHAGPWDIVRALRHELMERGLIPAGPMTSIAETVKKEGDLLSNVQWANKIPDTVLSDQADTVLFAECFHSPVQAGIYDAAVRVLEKIGKPVSVFSDGGCCGSSLYDFGLWDELQHLVETKWGNMRESLEKEFLFINPHCQEFVVKRYPEILPDSQAIKTRHFSELLLQSLKEGKLKSKKNNKVTVTYHDPCSLGRGLGIYAPPREVLAGLEGVELKEMKGNRFNSFCCGARALGEYHPEFSKETAKKGIENFEKTGAEILITACPYCKGAFEKAFSEGGKDRVKDLIEFVDEHTD